jgi:ABC-type dipeptide/oligopeptide/nickel transport system permease component
MFAFVPTVLLVSILVFVLVDFVPGDIIDAMQSPSEVDVNRKELEHPSYHRPR